MLLSLILILGSNLGFANDDLPRAAFKSFAECPATFNFHELTYDTVFSPDETFDRLVETASGSLWTGNSQFVQFHNEVESLKRESRGVRVGDIIELKLSIFLGAQHLPVFFEVLELNRQDRRVTFGYLSTNVTQGVQEATIVENEKGGSRIIHRTCYQSQSPARDKLYPPVHTSLIKGVYRHLYRGGN